MVEVFGDDVVFVGYCYQYGVGVGWNVEFFDFGFDVVVFGFELFDD